MSVKLSDIRALKKVNQRIPSTVYRSFFAMTFLKNFYYWEPRQKRHEEEKRLYLHEKMSQKSILKFEIF